uniref:Integrase family protein n=1 Tax=Geobacter sp. (strain M21) TaxID=443144 RepID=C6E2B6_GEOSM
MPKQVLPLTDSQVTRAKSQAKEAKLYDGGGLYLLISAIKLDSSGKQLPPTKLWRFKYRFAGKEKLAAFGAYPSVSLSEARKRREEAKQLLVQGVDPNEEKKARKAALSSHCQNTFEAVAREWHSRFKGNWSEKHAEQIMKRLEQEVFPFLGARPISEIKAPDLLLVLRQIEARTLETAHRVRIACGQVFRYAVATGRAEHDPVSMLRGALPPIKNNHFAAPVMPSDVGPLLKAIDGFKGSPIVKAAMQLAPHLFVRPGELRQAEWSEVDLQAGEWNIPAAKMKMGQPHLVPLSRQALQILQDLQAITGHGRYVFPCHRSRLRCMSENAVNAGLRRLGFEKHEITGHGFRAMARTILDEVLHFRPDIIEHQLAHAVKDPLGRAYNRTSHLAERRRMMQQWSEFLDQLKIKL